MKKLFTLVLMALMGLSALAQSKEEAKVAAQVEMLRVAMIDAKKAVLESLAAEELSYGHSGGHIENKAEFVDKIVSGRSDFVTIAFENQTIKIVGKTAVVRHDLRGTTTDVEGKVSPVNIHVLLVWQKIKGEWKMIARQAVKIPAKE